MDRSINDALRERGLRITPQRVRIWEILAGSGGHMTAEEVWEEASGALPGLELSTVYRTLDALCEAGLAVESRLPEGPRVFEAHERRHPHLVCERCGKVFHPEREADLRVIEVLNAVAGSFEVREAHVVATGLCAGCASRSGGEG
jgi:Fur family ferric uptake transcriptional regulator